MKRARKPVTGDVFEIKTAGGLGYLQFTHIAPDDEIPIVRVLPGIYAVRPAHLAELVKGQELYYTSFTLDHAVKTDVASLVENMPVPISARSYPVMRQRGTNGWFIGPASVPLTIEGYKNLRFVEKLKPEEKKLSIRKVSSTQSLIRDLERGWTPENDDFMNHATLQKGVNDSPSLTSKREFLDHYFYFSIEQNARSAARELRDKGWFAEARHSADGEEWLVVAKQPLQELSAPESDELRDEMEALARKFDGEYDGWGMAI